MIVRGYSDGFGARQVILSPRIGALESRQLGDMVEYDVVVL